MRTEELLDRCLNRKDLLAVFNEPEIRAHLQQAPHAEHIFLVIASPICEVGRDWDADWAIVEPSSMRSFIQLVGRIRRHRPEKWDITNVLLWSRNFKGLTNSKDHAAENLNRIMFHVENAPGRFPDGSKCVRQDIIQAFALGEPLFQAVGLLPQFAFTKL